MADFNKVLDAGDVDNGIVNVVIEIQKGSSNKVEWDRHNAYFKLDRVEPEIFAKPTDYGFIPQTLDEDGDELDVLFIASESLSTGVVAEGRVIGIMKFEDDGEVDDKVVCVPADDRGNGNAITSLDDLPKKLIEQIEFHFNHYKDLKKPGTTKVLAWEGIDEAKRVIKECQDRWTNK